MLGEWASVFSQLPFWMSCSASSSSYNYYSSTKKKKIVLLTSSKHFSDEQQNKWSHLCSRWCPELWRQLSAHGSAVTAARMTSPGRCACPFESSLFLSRRCFTDVFFLFFHARRFESRPYVQTETQSGAARSPSLYLHQLIWSSGGHLRVMQKLLVREEKRARNLSTLLRSEICNLHRP